MVRSKTCFKCNNEKPLSEFYKHPAMSDGHLNKCKECAKNDVKKHRKENESVREYDRRRYWENPVRMEYSKKQRKEWYDNNKEKAFENAKRYIKKNPEKRRAHLMVARAIKSGKLVKQLCEICGEKAHAHHEDYSKPLEVRWLCPTHHMRHHHGINKE